MARTGRLYQLETSKTGLLYRCVFRKQQIQVDFDLSSLRTNLHIVSFVLYREARMIKSRKYLCNGTTRKPRKAVQQRYTEYPLFRTTLNRQVQLQQLHDTDEMSGKRWKKAIVRDWKGPTCETRTYQINLKARPLARHRAKSNIVNSG